MKTKHTIKYIIYVSLSMVWVHLTLPNVLFAREDTFSAVNLPRPEATEEELFTEEPTQVAVPPFQEGLDEVEGRLPTNEPIEVVVPPIQGEEADDD
jgi:hypothetical protein